MFRVSRMPGCKGWAVGTPWSTSAINDPPRALRHEARPELLPCCDGRSSGRDHSVQGPASRWCPSTLVDVGDQSADREPTALSVRRYAVLVLAVTRTRDLGDPTRDAFGVAQIAQPSATWQRILS